MLFNPDDSLPEGLNQPGWIRVFREQRVANRPKRVHLHEWNPGVSTFGGAEKLIVHLDEVNYTELATNANTLICQLRSDLSQMRLAKLSKDADEVLGNVNGTIRHLDLVVANLDAGSLNDALAYVRVATKELDETLRKLKQYPAGFLLGRPPAPVSLSEKTLK